MPTYRDVLTINEKYARDNYKEDSGVKLLLLHFYLLTQIRNVFYYSLSSTFLLTPDSSNFIIYSIQS